MSLSTWFQPRLLVLHVLAAFAIVACALMGFWQLGVYGSKHEDETRAARAAKPVDLLTVWGPDDAFAEHLVGRRVRIDGTYAGEAFVAKRPDGQEWYATTVRVKGTRSSIIVVLGHVREVMDLDPPRPPLVAVLQPPDQSGDLSIAHRVNVTQGDLFSGYALLDQPSRTGLTPVAPPDPHVPWTVGLRNLAYALQWWVFGLFAGFMWWRMATDAVDVEDGVEEARIL
ncbi:MAG TPA: SURF1 family protein [Aeromicrobium sp.]|nr:SURF1 family protein [Aeromicrobium sp.]